MPLYYVYWLGNKSFIGLRYENPLALDMAELPDHSWTDLDPGPAIRLHGLTATVLEVTPTHIGYHRIYFVAIRAAWPEWVEKHAAVMSLLLSEGEGAQAGHRSPGS